MDNLLADTLEIVVAAGAAVMSFYESAYEIDEKSPGDPVTSADMAANELLETRLAALLPEAGMLSEETVDGLDRLMQKLVWIIDPLDGTKEFIQGVPEFAVSVALADLGQPRLAITYNPATEELFYAERGQGVFYNQEPVTTSGCNALEEAVVVASRAEVARGEFDFFTERVNLESVGSTAYRLARVAAGLADATWTRNEREEWDICAGHLLVVEAGGKCTDRDNKAITFNHHKTDVSGVIATNSHLHEQVIAALSEQKHSLA